MVPGARETVSADSVASGRRSAPYPPSGLRRRRDHLGPFHAPVPPPPPPPPWTRPVPAVRPSPAKGPPRTFSCPRRPHHPPAPLDPPLPLDPRKRVGSGTPVP